MKKTLENTAKGLIFALIVTVFATLSADLLYQPKKMVKKGYKIEIIDRSMKSVDGVSVGSLPNLRQSRSGNVAGAVDIAQLIKNADLKKGARIFKKCAACHNLARGAGNKIGPNLFGVIGRKRASVSGFAYSSAMKGKKEEWNYKALNQFLLKPKNYIPGTKMAFAGLKKDKDRANVIAYLQQEGR